jgi:hypothetical protein
MRGVDEAQASAGTWEPLDTGAVAALESQSACV